ncbi:Kynureninase [Elsinoe australis]|uniref:Kynureninase n=1 Tax=Elsinoe australis TaxID=40998 RepID=A0A2P7Z437_9PEZI|nr:Kynureninase [Elsinoe australis]
MDVLPAIEQLRSGKEVSWPQNADSLDFAEQLDQNKDIKHFRNDFVIPSKAQLKRKTLLDDDTTREPASDPSESVIYFCGNSLGLQPKATSKYLDSYLKTWGSIGVNGHFKQLEDSVIVPYQDMAADCARKSADIVGAAPEEIVIMNTLTVNLHLMMARFFKPTEEKFKILSEWRPFPSDFYAIESHIELHGRSAEESMVLVHPDAGGYIMSTSKILSMIDQHADELALILLPGIQYYSGQLLDIPTITAHAHSRGITIGWDLAHAAGNVELKLHDWDVDFACWCTYKYMNAGAGAIAGAFVHSKHGNNERNCGLKGWYGGDKSVRFAMDNKFVPTPGAQGFQLSNPSAVDLTCLSASLSVFQQTSISALRSRSLLLTAYAEHLLTQILSSRADSPHQVAQDAIRDPHSEAGGEEKLFRIITPASPLERGAQLSVLLREDKMEQVSAALEKNGVVCDKRKPGCIRVAPVPLYNTFADVWRFMEVFRGAIL